MKLKKQQRLSLLAILFSLVALSLIKAIGLGKYLSLVFPCITNSQDSIYCYSAYDMFIYAVLSLVIIVCATGLSIDFIRSMMHKR